MNLFSFTYPVYERYLVWQIKRSPSRVPGHVALILTESDLLDSEGISRLRSVLLSFRKHQVKLISLYVDILNTDRALEVGLASRLTGQLKEAFFRIPAGVGYEIYGKTGEVVSRRLGKDFFVYVSVGFGGRSEITKAVFSILKDVKAGKLSPAEVDEGLLESRLLVKHEPDLMIRSGGQHLSDFLVWQSVYSELYFTDVNWEEFRRLDLLRVIRDYQKRQRRYGK